MKKANLTLIFLLFGWSTIFAQIQKGVTYLAPLQSNMGAFGIADDKLSANLIGSTETGVYNRYNFVISPVYGYTLSDYLLIWTGATLTNTSIGSDSETDIDWLLNARFYLNPQSKNNHFFIEAGGRAHQGIGYKLSPTWGYQARVGLTHFINPSVAFELGAGHEEYNSSGHFAITSGFAVFLDREASVDNPAIESPIKKRALMIGNGLMNINFLSSESRSVILSPYVSYFLMDKLAAGVALTYANGHFSENGELTSWRIEPQLRYYWNTKPATALFATLGGGMITAKRTFFGTENEDTEYFYGLGLGLDAFLNSKFAFEFGPNFQHFPELKTFRVGLDVGVRMFL